MTLRNHPLPHTRGQGDLYSEGVDVGEMRQGARIGPFSKRPSSFGGSDLRGKAHEQDPKILRRTNFSRKRAPRDASRHHHEQGDLASASRPRLARRNSWRAGRGRQKMNRAQGNPSTHDVARSHPGQPADLGRMGAESSSRHLSISFSRARTNSINHGHGVSYLSEPPVNALDGAAGSKRSCIFQSLTLCSEYAAVLSTLTFFSFSKTLDVWRPDLRRRGPRRWKTR